MQTGKSYYVLEHRLHHSQPQALHLYGYQDQHLKWYDHLQVQKGVNDVNFPQKHPLLQLQQLSAYQSITNVRFADESYQAKIILQFVLNNLDGFEAEFDQDYIQFQYELTAYHLRRLLLNPIHFLDDHVTSPINDAKVIYLGFQKTQNNHGIFYRLLFSLQKQLRS